MTGNFSEAEMAWTSFTKGGVKVFKFLWNGLSREGNRKDELKKRVHPTQKPVGLFANIFERFDGFGSIYDGFLGSGSTLIACEKTNRTCYGMELDPAYCDVIVKRWSEYTGKQAIHAETGKPFPRTNQ
jgi:DNA modification methylase